MNSSKSDSLGGNGTGVDGAKSHDFCPYVGLSYFDWDHESFYFGRAYDARTLADNVLGSTLTVLYGPSGCGKTSLINVGLRKEIDRRHGDEMLVVFRSWQHVDFRSRLLESIAGRLREGLGDSTSSSDVEPVVGLEALCRAEIDSQLGSGRSIRDILSSTGIKDAEIVLVLDQFEEYLTYMTAVDPEGRLPADLAEWTESESWASDGLRFRILVGVRDDRLHLLDNLRASIPSLFDNTLCLQAMDDAGVRAAIEGPAREFGRQTASNVTVTKQFVDLLMDQLARVVTATEEKLSVAASRRTVELPYLQLYLEKLWKIAWTEGAVSLDEELVRNNDVEGILERHVREALDQLNQDERELCSKVFLHLVSKSGSKFRQSLEDLASVAKVDKQVLEVVLNKLTTPETRVLRNVPGPTTAVVFEIFHDVLAPHIVRWVEHVQMEDEAQRARKEAEVAEARAKAALQSRILWRVIAALASVAVIFLGILLATLDAREKQLKLSTDKLQRKSADMIYEAMPEGLFFAHALGMTDVEFHAAWELAKEDDGVIRDRFVEKISRGSEAVRRFGLRPSAFARALGLRWSAGHVRKLEAAFLRTAEDLSESDASLAIALVRAGFALEAQQPSWLRTGSQRDALLQRVDRSLEKLRGKSATDTMNLWESATEAQFLATVLKLYGDREDVFDSVRTKSIKAILNNFVDRSAHEYILEGCNDVREINPWALARVASVVNEGIHFISTRSISCFGKVFAKVMTGKDERYREGSPGAELSAALWQISRHRASDVSAEALFEILVRGYKGTRRADRGASENEANSYLYMLGTVDLLAASEGAAKPMCNVARGAMSQLAAEQSGHRSTGRDEHSRSSYQAKNAQGNEQMNGKEGGGRKGHRHRARKVALLTAPAPLCGEAGILLVNGLVEYLDSGPRGPVTNLAAFLRSPTASSPAISIKAPVSADSESRNLGMETVGIRWVPVFATKYSSEQAGLVMGRIAAVLQDGGGLREAGQATNSVATQETLSYSAALAVRSLSEKLRGEDWHLAMKLVKTELERSRRPLLSETWMTTLLSLLENKREDCVVENVLSVLRYPTTVGEATRTALEGIKKRIPKAPEASDVPWRAVEFAYRAYPGAASSAMKGRPGAGQVMQYCD